MPSPQGAGDHRGRQDHRQAGVGRQLGRREDPARPVVVAGGRQDRRRRAGGHRPGRRLGARLRSEDRQEALGVRPQPEGLGLAEDPQRSDQHAGHLRERRLHRQRPGSGARRRRRPPLRDRRRPSAATSPRPGSSGTTARSAARSRPARSTTASCSTRTSAASCTRVDVKTGKPFWKHDMFAAIWGSPMVIDGKVYLGDEDGDVTVLAADKTMKLIAENNMGSSVYSTPVPANGALFIVNRNQLFALSERSSAPRRQRPSDSPASSRAARDRRVAARRRCSSSCRRAVAAQQLAAFRGADAAGRRRPARRRPRGTSRRRRNVAWKTPIPGLAHSSPIVWGDRVYVTTAVAAERQAARSSPATSSKSGHRFGDRHRAPHLAPDRASTRQSGKIVWDTRRPPGRAAHEAARQGEPRLGDAGDRRPRHRRAAGQRRACSAST